MDMNEVSKFEQQVGALKLSEAMRVGAKIRPQCEHNYFVDGASCALGAAWEGAGMEGEPDGFGMLVDLFGIPYGLAEEIAELNDQGTTREDIATWLEAVHGF